LTDSVKHVYDSAWVRDGAAGNGHNTFSSRVVSPGSLEDARVDMRRAMAALDDFVASDTLMSTIGRENGMMSKAIRNMFKKQINSEWSDHKPICLEVTLKGGEREEGEEDDREEIFRWLCDKIERMLKDGTETRTATKQTTNVDDITGMLSEKLTLNTNR